MRRAVVAGIPAAGLPRTVPTDCWVLADRAVQKVIRVAAEAASALGALAENRRLRVQMVVRAQAVAERDSPRARTQVRRAVAVAREALRSFR